MPYAKYIVPSPNRLALKIRNGSYESCLKVCRAAAKAGDCDLGRTLPQQSRARGGSRILSNFKAPQTILRAGFLAPRAWGGQDRGRPKAYSSRSSNRG